VPAVGELAAGFVFEKRVLLSNMQPLEFSSKSSLRLRQLVDEFAGR
jgi:hypothetical protein